MQVQIGVKVLIKNKGGQYLFVQRAELLQNETELSWDIPGGRIEPHEPLHEALRREVMEELHIRLSAQPVLLNAQDIFIDKKQLHVVRLTYLATQDINDTDIRLSHEHEKYRWAAVQEMLRLHLDPYLKEILGDL